MGAAGNSFFEGDLQRQTHSDANFDDGYSVERALRTHTALSCSGQGSDLFDTAYALSARLRGAGLAGPQVRARNAALPAFAKGAVICCRLPPRGHTKGCRPLGCLSTIIAPCGGRNRPLARAIGCASPSPSSPEGQQAAEPQAAVLALKGESHVT